MGLEREETVVITIPNRAKADAYSSALLALLGKIELDQCEPELVAHIKVVYDLLSHLQPEKITE